MPNHEDFGPLFKILENALSIDPDFKLTIHDHEKLRRNLEALVRLAVLGSDPDRSRARWLIRACALQSGIIPASIHPIYIARGEGKTRTNFTVPAMNLRALPYHAAQAVFRAAAELDAKAMIFEIARSEIGYTDQRPAEYATCVLAAAIAEGYKGPIFIQGDHFQISASRYAQDPESEIQTVRELIAEAIQAGFYNIDIDTSTLVDLDQETIADQQATNVARCAEFTTFIRELEPEFVTVSVGGEIGEVGGRNSTEPELRAFMEGFNQRLKAMDPQAAGLSKISIQTGTSHGGVVLPDGSIAEVKVDFETLAQLSAIAREDYQLAGAVQHGASTLPEEAFSRFADAQACEVHLATNFQNMLFDRLPDDLRAEIYAYLDEQFAKDRKPDQTDEQFYYNSRKRALGLFKRQIWDMPQQAIDSIQSAWQQQFRDLFERLNIAGTHEEVASYGQPTVVKPSLEDYLQKEAAAEEVSDLAD